MTESRIMESINTAKKIINDLMESDAIFYDRTEGNELSGRFSVQMTFAESICYRPQYTVQQAAATLFLTDMVHCQFSTRIALGSSIISV